MAMLDLVWHGSRRQTNYCEGDFFLLHCHGRAGKFEVCEDVKMNNRVLKSGQAGFVGWV